MEELLAKKVQKELSKRLNEKECAVVIVKRFGDMHEVAVYPKDEMFFASLIDNIILINKFFEKNYYIGKDYNGVLFASIF